MNYLVAIQRFRQGPYNIEIELMHLTLFVTDPGQVGPLVAKMVDLLNQTTSFQHQWVDVSGIG